MAATLTTQIATGSQLSLSYSSAYIVMSRMDSPSVQGQSTFILLHADDIVLSSYVPA